MQIWQEQIDVGIGAPGERVSEDQLYEWYSNRTYDLALLDDAAAGDISALATVRAEAGCSLIS